MMWQALAWVTLVYLLSVPVLYLLAALMFKWSGIDTYIKSYRPGSDHE